MFRHSAHGPPTARLQPDRNAPRAGHCDGSSQFLTSASPLNPLCELRKWPNSVDFGWVANGKKWDISDWPLFCEQSGKANIPPVGAL